MSVELTDAERAALRRGGREGDWAGLDAAVEAIKRDAYEQGAADLRARVEALMEANKARIPNGAWTYTGIGNLALRDALTNPTEGA